ncbi:MAG: hypothetical protein HQL59_06500 [Magnetococcales bacterium]|nr:hypothetical protein [Magnetococcales bacterium]
MSETHQSAADSGKTLPDRPGVAPSPFPPFLGGRLKPLELVRILISGWWIVLGCLAAGGWWAFQEEKRYVPRYRSEVLLHSEVATQGSAGSQLVGLLGLGGGTSASSDSLTMAILTSRVFLEKFVEEEKLLPLLNENLWDKRELKWREPKSGEVPSPRAAAAVMRGNIEWSPGPGSGMTILAVKWVDPALTHRWANLLVERINAFLREREIEISRQSIEYLKEELARTQVVELRQGLTNLIESEVKKIMLANVKKEFAFRVIDPAIEPTAPIGAELTRIWIRGFGLGFLASVAGAIFWHFLRVWWRSRSRRSPSPG